MRPSTTLRAGRLAQSLSRPLRQSPAVVRINSRAHSTAVDTPISYAAAPPPPPPPQQQQQQQRSGLDGKKLMAEAVAATKPRNNWTREEIAAIYYQPLLELTYQSV
jgi:biotin synthase